MAEKVGVRPLHDRLLVARLPEEEKTAGGLFIPDTAKKKNHNKVKLSPLVKAA